MKGLSLDSVAALVQTRLDDLEYLWDVTEKVLAGKSSVGEGDLKKVALILVEQLPDLTASIIALGEGDANDDAIKAARSLPAPVQLEVLVSLAELTFEEVGGIKKFVSRMKEALGKTGTQSKVSKPGKGTRR